MQRHRFAWGMPFRKTLCAGLFSRQFRLACSNRLFNWLTLVALAFCSLLPFQARAEENVAPLLITQAVDESKLTTLEGNTRPEAKPRYDRGRVPDSLPIEHLFLLLKRSPQRERDLEKLIDDLHNPSSPSFHKWLTATEFGIRFGVAQEDREAIKNWLRSHGFKINVDYPSAILIDFSGTAGQVRQAFHTEIHSLELGGVKHIANMTDPQIPAALAPAIQGIVSLHDFRPRPMYQPHAQYTVADNGTTHYLVVPGDLETIYNLNPLFSSGISGQGRTVVVLEDTDVYTTADWTSFRSVFGLSSYTDGSFTQIHPAPPSGTNNCTDPGAISGADLEAIVDAEYASAAAPSAAIVLASCQNSASGFGGLVALANLLNQTGTPPEIVSLSYGECEAVNGAASNAAFNSTYQQAVAEGVSVFVSSGDHAAAMCDQFDAEADYGIAVSGYASSPYDVAVGGTDFGDTYAGTNSTYWNSNNSKTFESAKSYIPEIPWNDSCASQLLAEFNGFSETYGTSGFCNSSQGANYLDTIGASGGPSACATGAPSQSQLAGGTCAGWPKPSYQSLLGNPNDTVRDLPDLALFAADGVWLHSYPICFTGPGGTPCTEAPVNWQLAGGTSFTAPIMAGIQALVNQKANARQGNPSFVYYNLAGAEYGTAGDKSCNSTLGNAAASSCVFYDVTKGDNDVPCIETADCYLPSGSYGVLSTSDSAYQPAFGADVGWDFASGIGTVNAYNLVTNWPVTPTFTLSANPTTLTLSQGTQVTSTIDITPLNGFSGSVSFSASALPSGVRAAFSPNPSTSASTLTLTATDNATAGTYVLTVTGTSGSLTETVNLSLTVTAPPTFALSASPNTLKILQASQGTSTITITPANGFSGNVNLTASGLPSGVTAAFSPNPATSTSTLTLTATATASTGTSTVTITGTSGSLTKTTTIALTVAAAPTFTLSASPNSLKVVQGSQGTSTITITPLNGFDSTVGLLASSLPSGVTAVFTPNPTASTSTLTLTASTTAATGNATVTITGTSGTLSETTTISLTVIPPAGFTLSASPSTLTLVQANQVTSAISITPANGFDDKVSLSASGLPNGVTAAFNPNPATSTSTLTLTASSTAALGTATVTVTGTSGGLTETTTISLTVTPPPTFTLSANPNTLKVIQGSQSSSTVTITPANGFTGSVSLTASGLPTGVTAAFSPNPATSTSTLTLTASTTAATGTATVTITGTSGSLTQTTTISLTVAPPPTFTLSANPAALSVAQGSQVSSTITITPANGFNSSVSLTASGLPSGVTAAFTPNPATSTSTLTLTASTTAATGTATVTVTGTSGSLTATTTISLSVSPQAGFTLSASPSSLTVFQGSHGTSTITISAGSGFNSSVSLSASGLPAGVTAAFNPNAATSTSTLTLTASATATTGNATITVTGTAGTLTETTTLSLTIAAPPSFKLSTSPNTLSLFVGGQVTSALTITPVNGFNSSVALTASGLPNGVTAAFTPDPATSTSTLTLTASKTAKTGTATITITGTSGTLTAATTLTIKIPVPGFTLTASPTSATISLDSAGTSTVTVVPTGGFTGQVTLDSTGLPAGMYITFRPNPTSSTSDVTFTATNSAPLGTYTVTITGASGKLSGEVNVELTIIQ